MLASIQKIKNIYPIENADKIEVAEVLGWKVVVRKNEFKIGDLCIYIETDTLIPRKDWSEFLFKDKESTKYRLRTIKLRGQISQGLILNTEILIDYFRIINDGHIVYDIDNEIIYIEDCSGEHLYYDGDDVSELLEVEKYEKPIPIQLAGEVKRYFPAFLRKTDEINIQSAPELLELLRNKPYQMTLKMDGTSATYYKFNGEFGVCSRNLELKENHDNTYWIIADKYHIRDWLPDNYAIQGEICGPGIQENKIGLKELTLYIFNVWNINKQQYENWDEFIFDFGILEKLESVPHVGCGNKFDPDLENIEYLLKIASLYMYENDTPCEGIVVRNLDQTVSFKVKNNDFLLKYGE